jgi:hypothetical protein
MDDQIGREVEGSEFHFGLDRVPRLQRKSLRLHTPGRHRGHPWLSPPVTRNSRDVVPDAGAFALMKIQSRTKLQYVFGESQWSMRRESAI